MYHPGKVLDVYSSKDKNVIGDASIQATIMMWDENLFTFLVDPKLANKIKIGDIVRLDYGKYIIFVRVKSIKNTAGKQGVYGYMIQYIDNTDKGNTTLPDLLHTSTGYYCAYDSYKILENEDEVMVELL